MAQDESRYFVMRSPENAGKRYSYRGAIFDGEIMRSGGYVVLFPKSLVEDGFGHIDYHTYLPATQDEMALGVVINTDLFNTVEPFDKAEIIWLEQEEEDRIKLS